LPAANREVVEKANFLALVVEPDPACIDTADRVRRAIQSGCGAPQATGTVIVNRAAAALPVELEGIEDQLAIIPPEPDLCLRAQTPHAPMVTFLPESLMAENLMR
jgi:hypothetical protein